MKTIHSSILLLILCTCITTSFSQNIGRKINRADRSFYEYDFKRSLKQYLKILETDTSAHVIRGIAQSYAYLQDHEKSNGYFKMLVEEPSPLPFDLLEYAQSLKRIGNYEEARNWFEQYRKIYPLDLRARNHSVNTYHYKKLARNKKNPLFFALDINDEGSIMGYTIAEDKIIFSKSTNNGSFDFMDSPEIFLDVMEGTLNEEMELENLKYMPFVINSNMHDGPSSYDKNTKTLAFTRNASLTTETKETGVQLEILFSQNIDGKWQESVPFKYNSEDYSVGHPAFSPDGKRIYFISNQPDGFGGTDIYVSKKLGREWSEPENLGPEVNTESDEMFPFATEGDVLYFSTEGHAGLGGLDIFKTYPFEEYWAKPENMAAPVNSRADDFSFALVKQGEALFSSNRVGGFGSDDVYYVNLQETKKFFSIPTKLIENENVSPISVVHLKSGIEEFHKMGESAFLDLNVKDSGYKVTWFHMGEKRQINISGKRNDYGILEIDFSGLKGLKPTDFLSQIDVQGSDNNQRVRIDQKVWTYERNPADDFLSDEISDPPNYAKGKDNVIILTKDGKELRAETYPKPINIESKTVIYMDENTAENQFEKFEEQLQKFCNAYSENNEDYVSIKLIKSEVMSAVEMETFGDKVEDFIIKNGVSSEHIQLEWLEQTAHITGEELSTDFEIFITVDSKFTLVE